MSLSQLGVRMNDDVFEKRTRFGVCGFVVKLHREGEKKERTDF